MIRALFVAVPSILTAALLTLSSAEVSASTDLAKAKNCVACHAADKKLIGPAYKDIAAKYANDKEALTKLTKKVREGGVGGWGQIPMPANPQVSADEAGTLVKWILTQK